MQYLHGSLEWMLTIDPREHRIWWVDSCQLSYGTQEKPTGKQMNLVQI